MDAAMGPDDDVVEAAWEPFAALCPCVGIRPVTPQNEAGTLMDPPPSDPGHMRAPKPQAAFLSHHMVHPYILAHAPATASNRIQLCHLHDHDDSSGNQPTNESVSMTGHAWAGTCRKRADAGCYDASAA